MRRILSTLVPLLLLVGCNKPSPDTRPVDNPTPSTPPPAWTEDMQAVANGNNRFALDLYAKLRDREDGNLFFSPYSAHTALAMTATGARGTTRDQMVKVLYLPTDEQKALASGDLGKFYAHPRKEFQLSVANALWGQKDYPWRPEFLELQKTRFGSAFNEANFTGDPNGERKRINRWAEERTNGKIKELLAEPLITQLTRLVLANAIYFKGEWETKFKPEMTSAQPFTLSNGMKVDVPMMSRRGGFRLYTKMAEGKDWKPEFQVAELPYKGGELSMVIVLPGKHDGLPALEKSLTAESLATWLKQVHEDDDIHIFLPKFRIETPEMVLNEPLKQLGMVAAFDSNAADFTGQHTGPRDLFVNAVVQKAFVDVNEEGTEAAAVTAVVEAKKGESFPFHANRPFLFLIRDVKHGTILFMGRVTNPKP